MSQTPPRTAPERPDTPPESVDEMPPYGEPSRWRLALVVGLVLAFLVGCALVVGLAARGVWRLLMGRPAPEGVIMFPSSDQSFAGPLYTVQFYDGTYRQLRDLALSVALVPGVPVEAQLQALAVRLAAQVRQRDGEICERPRVVVVDGAGRTLHEWSGAA